jgi:hypothetical protein
MSHSPVMPLADHRAMRSGLASSSFLQILRDADALLALMGSESLYTVARLANVLSTSAKDAGDCDLAEAAKSVGRIASGEKPVALTAAFRNLTAAIARAQLDHSLSA